MRLILDFRNLTAANKQTILDNIDFFLEKQKRDKKEGKNAL